jgi:hypothetical protein
MVTRGIQKSFTKRNHGFGTIAFEASVADLLQPSQPNGAIRPVLVLNQQGDVPE